MPIPSNSRRAFTMVEIVVVVGLLAAIGTFIFFQLSGNTEKAQMDKALAELSQITNAAHRFIIDNKGALPGDADRGLPPGIEAYLGSGSWPAAPWPHSVYDWDVFPDPLEGPNYQISIRFCPLGMPAECDFPDEPWAANFDYYSSVYYCIQGDCKAHPAMPADHPGYCVGNCPSR